MRRLLTEPAPQTDDRAFVPDDELPAPPVRGRSGEPVHTPSPRAKLQQRHDRPASGAMSALAFAGSVIVHPPVAGPWPFPACDEDYYSSANYCAEPWFSQKSVQSRCLTGSKYPPESRAPQEL